MRYYAKDNNGRDIFFVEIVDVLNEVGEVNKEEEDIYYVFDEDWLVVTDYIRSSLPVQVFSLSDVNQLANSLYKRLLNSETIHHKEINNLICLIKSKEQFTFYYFQENELTIIGKYDENKAEVMHTLLEKTGVQLDMPYNLQSTPFEFRYILEKLNLVEMIGELMEISKSEFELAIQNNEPLIDLYLSLINPENIFRRKPVEMDGNDARLYVLQRHTNPQLIFILPVVKNPVD